MAEALHPSRLDRGTLLRMAGLGIVGMLAVTVEAAPLGISAAAWPSPDLLFCVVAFWALRAPQAVPVLLVFALGLMRDLLTDLPVGLGALTLVFGAEVLKGRQPTLTRQPFGIAWGWVALVAAGMAAALWIGVAVSLAEPPGIGPLALQVLATALVYPAVAVVLPLAVGRARRAAGAER